MGEGVVSIFWASGVVSFARECSPGIAFTKGMRIPAKQYREQLHRLRSHPRHDELPDFHDARDSFTNVYLSLVPFSVLEYFIEISYEVLPGGLVFPVGFLLFWAFYYTYYQPGFLENRLTSPPSLNLSGIPILIVGILIWFVKVTFVEISHLVFLQWWVKTSESKKPAGPKAGMGETRPSSAPPGAKTAPPPLLSKDLVDALQILGLKPGCSWREIHKQYRQLAKQFHPDLNPDITDFGHRFMRVDSAYQKLGKVRSQHFPE